MLNIFFKKAIILHVQIKKKSNLFNTGKSDSLLCTIKNSLFFVVCGLMIKILFQKNKKKKNRHFFNRYFNVVYFILSSLNTFSSSCIAIPETNCFICVW